MNTTDRRPPEDSTRRLVAYLGVGLVVPTVAVLTSIIAQVIAWPRLPDQIAVHWNAAGEADRWGAPWTILVLTVVLGLGLPLLAVVPNLRPLKDGGRGPSFRIVATVVAASVAGIAYLLAASVVSQTDGQSARPGVEIGIAIAVAVLVGGLGWLTIPRDLPRQGTAARPLSVARGERVVWIGTETISRWFVIITVVALGLSALFVATAGTSGAGPSSVIAALAITLVVIVIIATSVAFHVRIDADGLRVQSILGVPRFHVPADDIERVDVIHVRAIGDFGGYGIRHHGGALGVILRSGAAVEVTRRSNGRRFVVTVGDAGTAAATLATVSMLQE